jgi:transposase-like protein
MIGGEGKVVEIDEAKFGQRKYHRGRMIEGQWIFGGFERGSKKSMYVPVPARNAETLTKVILKWIKPGTTIISDCWKAYSKIGEFPYTHLTVNHSLNFVDPETGAHTQNIERSWRDARGLIPRYGRTKGHCEGYLAEFQFKKCVATQERLHEFLKTTANLKPQLNEF